MKIAIVSIAVALLSFHAGAQEQIIGSPPGKVENRVFTPVGAKCVGEADAKGLVSKEWRKYVAECARVNHVPHPHEKELTKCFTDAEPYRGTSQWIAHVQPCVEGYVGKAEEHRADPK